MAKAKGKGSVSDSADEGEEHIHDTVAPGGRYIVGGVEVNARGHAFNDDPEKNLAPSRRELDTEVEE